MRLTLRIALLCAVFITFLAAAPASIRIFSGHAADSQSVNAGMFAWFSGDWEMTSGPDHIEEHWTRPEGGTLVGMGRTVRAGKTVEFEYLRIEERPDGVYYVAHPFARPGTDFKMAKFDGTQVVFENPQHAFPARVVYRKNPDGTLFARIEGTQGGKPAAVDFPYQRMK